MLNDRAVSNRVRIFNLCAGTQLLPNVVSTEQQSLIVVKKLLAIAVSSITYLRGLFPEKAYGRKYVEVKVMILREERTCPGASQIVQWLYV
uniref:HORMA domain-containing protein n=1 Tax=Oncorhynchus mykiss TaxID=8022 RepID=A0A8K9XYP8_ONCMY